MEGNEQYSETQRSPRGLPFWTVAVAGIGGLAVLGFGLYQQMVLGEPWGTRPVSAPVFVLIVVGFVVLMAGVLTLLATLRLELSVTGEAFRFRMPPLLSRWKEIPLADIVDARTVEFSPIRDFGGYGIRVGALGTGYILTGPRGLGITLKGGKALVFSTARPDELVKLLHQPSASPRG